MSKLASVIQGTIELPSGKTVEVGSKQWFDWLADSETKSFRVDAGSGYTARKETAKGYWYGYRKVGGKLHKRYIGLSEGVTPQRLAEVGELFNVPSKPKLPKPVSNLMVSGELHNKLGNLEADNLKLHNRVTQLKAELAEARSQLSTILELPDAADLLNQLKSKRKKSKTDLQDVEAILELLPEMPAQQQPQAQIPDLYAARDKLFEMPSLGGWKLEKGEKRERFWAFAEALIEETSKLNPDYSIIQRLQSDLKQEREYSQGIAKGMSEEFTKRVNLERKMGLRK